MQSAHVLPIFALSACVGAGIGRLLPSASPLWCLAACGLWLLLFVGRSVPALRGPAAALTIASAIAALGVIRANAIDAQRIPDNDYNERWELIVEVTQGCRPAQAPCSFEGAARQRRLPRARTEPDGPSNADDWITLSAPQSLRFYLSDGAWVPLTGDQFLAVGRYRPAESGIHPYTFDSKSWSDRRGIHASFMLDEAPILRSSTSSWRRMIDRRRVNAELAMASAGHEEAVGVLQAMITGTKSGLSEEIRTRFAASGIAHVLAVSGMHLSLMSAALYFGVNALLSRMRWLLMRWNAHAIGALICIPVIVLYVVFTGAPSSAIRAGIMAIAVLLPKAFDRRGSGLQALSVAVLVMLANNPLLIVDMGFQLSVAATLSLVLLSRETSYQRTQRASGDEELEADDLDAPDLRVNGDASAIGDASATATYEDRPEAHTSPAHFNNDAVHETLVPTMHLRARAAGVRWWRTAADWVWTSVVISTVSTLATAPFLVWGFGGIPWASPLPNLLVVPPLSIIAMPAAAIGAFMMNVAPWIAKPALWVAIHTTELCLWLCRVGAPVFEQEWVLGRPHLLGVVGWGLVAALSPWLNRRRRLPWAALMVGVAFIGIDHHERGVRDGFLEIHAIPVGQGDASWVRFPNGMTMLIDAGGTGAGKSRTGTRYVIPYLRAHGTRRVDVLVATHGDADHINGIIELVQTLRPRAIWVGGLTLERHADRALYLEAKAIGAPVVSAHERWERAMIGDVALNFLPSDRYDSSNDGSLAFQLVYRDFQALFTGDIEKDREASLLRHARNNLDAHYLKIAHHGSRTSSTPAFIDAVDPQIGVVHAGLGNSYQLPREDVLDRYRARDVQLWRTDRGAAVVHATDGAAIYILRRH